jgi:ankyrin repeat protein
MSVRYYSYYRKDTIMQRRAFLHNALLLGATGALPVALAARQLSNEPPTITGLVLPPLDDTDTFDLLEWAINRERLGIVKSMIEQGIDVNMEGGWNSATPLHAAASRRSMEVVQYLISKGANVNATDKDGDTPLHNAHWIDMIQYLMLQGADVNARGRYGRTPLHVTARHYHRIGLLEYLVTHGADVHAKDNDGMTALDYMMKNEVLILERMEERSNVPEGVQRNRQRDLDRVRKTIDMLRSVMG